MTRLFYVDESRDRPATANGHHFHVGILGDGPAIAAAEQALDEVVERAHSADLVRLGSELHASEIWDQRRAWKKCTISDAVTVLEEAALVVKDCGLEVIARGVRLKQFQNRYPGGDPYRWEFSNLLERLNERLRNVDDLGLVIADQQHQYRELLQIDLATAKSIGTGGYRDQRLDRILDTAHFVDSSRSRLVQLADIAAFVLRRRATFPTEHDPRLEKVMKRLSERITDGVPEPTGQYFTIR